MFQLCKGRFCAGGIRHRNEIMRRQEVLLMAAKNLPQTPPDAVTNNGVPDAARRDKPGAKLGAVDFQAAKGNERSPNERSLSTDAFEVGPLEEPAGPGKTVRG
jgi:hypothetical protein